jgi:hypothetical protein
MESFYIIVSIVTVVFLIFLLTVVGIIMKNTKQTQQFPPNIEQCPDMWIPDGSYCHFDGVNSGVYTSTNGKYLSEGTVKYDENYKGDKVPFFTKGGTDNIQSTTINPSDTKWSNTGVSTICAQNEWAKKYGIQWSGITELNTCSK